jgi:adenine phosphoribosyltransferase
MTYLNLIDTQTRGRYDVTPLFNNYAAFTNLVDDLAQRFADVEIDRVAGIDALGFILGAAIAMKMQKGFIPIRKGGKLPARVERAEFVDYTKEHKALEIRLNAVTRGMKVLIVDEWIETGAQMKAAIELVERLGGVVVGVATINMDENNLTRALREKYNCQAIRRGE